MSRCRIMKEEEKMKDDRLPDLLQGTKKHNPFQIPHNYFREFPDQLMEKIIEESEKKNRESWWQSIFTRWHLALSPKPIMALGVMAVVAALFWLSRPGTSSLQDEFTSGEIAQYIQEHIDDFEVSDFYVQDLEGIDILAEEIEGDDVKPILDDLMEEMDLETLQRIL